MTDDWDTGPGESPTLSTFVSDPHAEPPFAKCRKLESRDTKFRKYLDGAPDECDTSLASIAAIAGWTAQEIVNLLVANRREKCAAPKEEDYYARIIVKARAPITQAAAQERLEANDGDRAKRLADLSTLLGLEPGYQILDLVRYEGDPPEYWMETSAGAITLGRIQTITSQPRFQAFLAATTRQVVPLCTGALWHKRAQAILLCCRDVELGEASHPVIGMAEMVETYLTGQTILDDQNVAAEQGFPFRKNDAVLFPLSEFRQYLRFAKSETLSAHKLGQRLRMCGIEPVVIYVVIEGRETSRNYWRVAYA